MTTDNAEDKAKLYAGLMEAAELMAGMDAMKNELSRIGMPENQIDDVMSDILGALRGDHDEEEST